MAGGVVCVALGLRTHPAIKIDGLVVPPRFVRQVGAQSFGEKVRAGRDGWQIATGVLLLLNGIVIGGASLKRHQQRQQAK